MIGRQRIATVSGLIGALAVLYSGAAPAYADDPKGDCTISEQGDIVCVKKSEVIRKDKRGKYVVKQKQDCETIERPRLVYPEGNLLNGGDVRSGPVVECSNKTKLPKGYKLPKIKF
ncbi:hypothetical protein QQM39_24385 [Streptomyces sp. DT2A-34]|uniref:hypothetical protein n=1 Tax=Streptomyces sp. DT2A-34 TaxID=3051182 RepID=UPI00265C5B2D|nr:hypothetical protein [Streptomyces sp. DT2A-34]MDO0913851.1 hypothetical protein [Streptomyces sp. DT2A-34]